MNKDIRALSALQILTILLVLLVGVLFGVDAPETSGAKVEGWIGSMSVPILLETEKGVFIEGGYLDTFRKLEVGDPLCRGFTSTDLFVGGTDTQVHMDQYGIATLTARGQVVSIEKGQGLYLTVLGKERTDYLVTNCGSYISVGEMDFYFFRVDESIAFSHGSTYPEWMTSQCGKDTYDYVVIEFTNVTYVFVSNQSGYTVFNGVGPAFQGSLYDYLIFETDEGLARNRGGISIYSCLNGIVVEED